MGEGVAYLVGRVADAHVKVRDVCLYKVAYYDLELSLLWARAGVVMSKMGPTEAKGI